MPGCTYIAATRVPPLVRKNTYGNNALGYRRDDPKFIREFPRDFIPARKMRRIIVCAGFRRERHSIPVIFDNDAKFNSVRGFLILDLLSLVITECAARIFPLFNEKCAADDGSVGHVIEILI